MKIVDYCCGWNMEKVVALVACAARVCTEFTLVAAEHREDEATALLRDLLPYLASTEAVSAWPGTIKLDGETRELMKFRVDPASVRRLIDDIMPVLFGPDPAIEDLGMLRSDGRPYLVMITHERDVFLKLEPSELSVLASAVGAQNLRVQGEDEVPEERY